MKVLHLPWNIASQISVSVRALQDIGIDAHGIARETMAIQDSASIHVYNFPGPRHPFRRGLQSIRFAMALRAGIRWADVIHYHWLRPALSSSRDLAWIAQSKKPRVVEVWGSDIRMREVAIAGNPYLARFFESNPDFGSDSHVSITWQREFARHGFSLLVPGREMLGYVSPDVFPRVHNTAARLILNEFEPAYPNPNSQRPVVVHAPSRLELKGTPAVLAAIERLRSKYDFEFKILHEVAHSEAMKTVRQCDIFLDQFVLGEYGLASIEAMAFGKPVVCYIKNPAHYPDGLPILNATQESLTEVVESLLRNSDRRHEIGVLSRAYVDKYHDAHKVAHELVSIYTELRQQASHAKDYDRR